MPVIYRSILGLTEEIMDIHDYSLFLIDEELYYIQQNHQEADNKTKHSIFVKTIHNYTCCLKMFWKPVVK